MSYKPPISAKMIETSSFLPDEFIDAVANDVDHYIFCAFKRVFDIHNIEVDEEELKKALNYDREQYYKGYQDGYQEGHNDKEKEIIHCKDCKYLIEIDPDNLYVCARIDFGMDGEPNFLSPENDFCSRGERRETQ